MKPYYEEDNGNIQIYCGDCLDILPSFPEKSVDLVLTDPPYGVQKVNWDSDLPPIKVWENTKRIMKDNASILVFGGIKRMPEVIEMLGGKFNYQWVFVWYKSNASQFGKTGYSKLDIALWYAKGIAVAKNKKLDIIIDPIIPSKNNFGHPTPKPIKVIKHIIECLSNEDDVILDPFLGSGTTAVAAKELGRKCIGIEISKEYCDIAIKRLKNTQKDMFL